jgi:ribosomal protein S18 acetylase RimI-like enzyme
MTIRRLLPANAAEYRRLRLRGLRESPTAFGSSFAEESRRPFKAFVARLEQTEAKWVFGAFERKRLVGVVTLLREEKMKERHKASIVGMYVDPKTRRKGVGRQLLDAAIDAARQLRGLKQVRLGVVEVNRPALRLYRSAGFKLYGREEAALLVAGKFYSELFLVHRL